MTDPAHLKQTIEKLEKQRPLLGDEAVDVAIAALQKELAHLQEEASSLKETPGERKLVTVIFADLSGFTALSEREDPEVVRRLVNATFEKLAKIIMGYGGFIEKYIGDEIMAIFGAPVSYEDHVERALRSALDMMGALAACNREQGTDLDLHIGINTGKVVTGIIGARQHQQYGVTGDAVNLAARLKHASKGGQIFVGPETFRLSHRAFDFSELPPMDFKGKSEPVQVYLLQQQKSRQISRWGTGLSSSIVGREKELEIISDVLRELKNGRGGRLAVVGEAGIGKSRLVAEFKKQGAGEVKWVEGRSLSYARESAFLPVREILSNLIDVSAEMGEKERRKHFLYHCEKLIGPESKTHFAFLAHLMQFPLTQEEEERIGYFPAAALNEKVHAAVQTYLMANARQKPLVLVWEDIHWADPASLRLVEALMKDVQEFPLFFLLVFRPVKEEKIWSLHQQAKETYGSGYRILELGSLPKDQSGSLIMNLTNAESVDSEVAKLIFSRTAGNPFFVEELTRSLMDQGVLHLDGKELKATSAIEEIELPTTLQGVIASRIDRLESDDKFLLQTASVLGRIFERHILEKLLGKAGYRGDFDSSIHELLYRELLREKKTDKTGTKEFIFKHAYTQEVAYHSLLISHREHLHEIAGLTFEELAGESPEEYAAIIGYHYERTAQKDKAVRFLELGADQAHKRHINDEAIHLYSRAIEQLQLFRQGAKDDEEHLRHLLVLWEKLGNVQEVNGQHQEAVASFKKALADPKGQNVQAEVRLYRKIGISLNSSRQVEMSQDAFGEAEKRLKKVTEEERSDKWWGDWIDVQLDRQFLYYFTNNLPEMERSLDQLSRDIQQKGTPDQRARFFQTLVMLRFRKEIYFLSDETHQLAGQMMEATGESRNERVILLSKFLYGMTLLFHEDLEESILVLKETRNAAKKWSDVINLVRSLNYLTLAYRRLGNVAKTEKYNKQTLAIAESINLVEYLASGNANRAWLHWKSGDVRLAQDYGEKGLAYYRETGKLLKHPVPLLWIVCWPLVAAYHAEGKWSKCIEYFKILLDPKQRPMEPALRSQMEKVVGEYTPDRTEKLDRYIGRAIELAQQYRHL